MTPLMPLKANDFAKLFQPQLPPPIIPPVANHTQKASEENDKTILYMMSFLFVVFIITSAYSIYQNIQILQGLEAIKATTETIMPGIASNSNSALTKSNKETEDAAVKKSITDDLVKNISA